MATPPLSAAVALCLAGRRCRGGPAGIARQMRADALAHATSSTGFAGDTRHHVAGRFYGDLAWAAGY